MFLFFIYKMKKIIVIFSSFILGLIAIIGFLIFAPEKEVVREKKIPQVEVSGQEKGDKSNSSKTKNNTTLLKDTPVKTPDFLRKSYYDLTKEDEEDMIEYSKSNFIGWFASSYPNEGDGFTTDKTSEFTSNGIPNHKFITVTGNDLNRELSYIIYRIINPNFGDWTEFQYPTYKSSIEMNQLMYSNITGNDFSQKISSNKIPQIFYADYGKNNYANKLEKSFGDHNARFIGEIKSGSISVDDKNNINVKMTVDYKLDDKEIFDTRTINLILKLDNKKLYIIDGNVENIESIVVEETDKPEIQGQTTENKDEKSTEENEGETETTGSIEEPLTEENNTVEGGE